MPKGALALVMHSCEIPNGNYWGQQTAIAAVDAVSSRDLVGVLEYDFRQGVKWVYPLAEAGDKFAVKRAINSLTFGDMPSFDASLQAAVTGLANVAAGQKHCIVISDGDPAGPAPSIIQQFINQKISVSTVAVFPHSWGGASADLQKMRWIAQSTGGEYYEILQQNQLASLPQIFIKEAQTVKRSLIWEGDPFRPAHSGVVSEPLRGLGRNLPPVSGYIVTAEREGLALVTLHGPENDPILAQWQYGLGRVVALTTDGAGRWCPDWPSWGSYRAFWEQHTRWAMRPTGSANMNIITETRGEETLVTVEALDAAGEPLNFANFVGRAVRPDLTADPVELRQTAPGRYEGRMRTKDAGAYVINLRYEAVSPGAAGGPLARHPGGGLRGRQAHLGVWYPGLLFDPTHLFDRLEKGDIAYHQSFPNELEPRRPRKSCTCL